MIEYGVMQGVIWDKGGILESPDSFVESLVQHVHRDRFRFELGDASSGPRLSRAQSRTYEVDRARDNVGHVGFGRPQSAHGPFSQESLGQLNYFVQKSTTKNEDYSYVSKMWL